MAGNVLNSIIYQVCFHSLLLYLLGHSLFRINKFRSRNFLSHSSHRLAELTVFLYKCPYSLCKHSLWFLAGGFPARLVTHAVCCQAIMEMNPSTHGCLPRIICHPICAFAANFCSSNICPMVITQSI